MLLPVIVTSCWHQKILIWESEFLASCQCSAICWMALCQQSAGFFFKSILYSSSLPARESGFLVNVDRTPPSDSTAHSTNVSCPYLTSSPRGPLCLCSPPCISGSKVWKSIQHHFKALSSFCFLFFYISKHPSEVETCCVVHASAVWFDQIFWWTEGGEVARDKQRQNES